MRMTGDVDTDAARSTSQKALFGSSAAACLCGLILASLHHLDLSTFWSSNHFRPSPAFLFALKENIRLFWEKLVLSWENWSLWFAFIFVFYTYLG